MGEIRGNWGRWGGRGTCIQHRMEGRGRGSQRVISLSAPGRGSSLAAYSCGIQGLVAAAAVWASGTPPPGASPETRRSLGLACRLQPPASRAPRALPSRCNARGLAGLARPHLRGLACGGRARPRAQTLATHPGHCPRSPQRNRSRSPRALRSLARCWAKLRGLSRCTPEAKSKGGQAAPAQGWGSPRLRALFGPLSFLSFLFSPGGQIKKLEIRSRRPDAQAKILNKSPRDV